MTDPFVNVEYTEDSSSSRGAEVTGPGSNDAVVGALSDGDITDPNEGEDFDGIVDPNEDEDFDSDGK